MHLRILQIMQNVAYLLADGCAPRLARGEYGMSLFTAVFRELGEMGCLAGAFRAFEGDEHNDEIRSLVSNIF